MSNIAKINNYEVIVKEHEGHRVVTFKDIDAVHERPEGTARKRFNDNKKHLIEGEDFFVRKTDEAKKEFGITAPNGLVLLTESGYLMLVKSFTDDLAWTVQRQLVKTYFSVKNGTASKKQNNKKEKNLSATNMLVRNISAIFKDAGVNPTFIAAEAKRIYKEQADIEIQIPLLTDSDTPKLWDCTSIAKELGIMSEAGKPHDKAVSAIIQKLDIFADEVVRTAYSRNGHDGVTVQYKPSVLDKVLEWLNESGYPTVIEHQLSNGSVKKCHVAYVEVA